MAKVYKVDDAGRGRSYKVKAEPKAAAERIAERARRYTDDTITVEPDGEGLVVRGRYPDDVYDGTDGVYELATVTG